ncbi:glycine C-acetyltransferase [bacterium A37T11]|nr:glycine C-acetyltransferase [bacterium A37T11]
MLQNYTGIRGEVVTVVSTWVSSPTYLWDMKTKHTHKDPRKKIDFSKASFKDFEHIEGMNVFERSAYFVEFQEYLERQGHFNYRLESQDGCGPVMRLKLPGESVPRECVCLVSNDYLGFTQHPAIKATHKWAIDQFGSGAGASPAIGGHFNYHGLLEKKIAGFYGQEDAILYTTGYTANSATLPCLLGPKDIAIVDMAVHASVYEGLKGITVKRFLHNDMDMLTEVLKNTQRDYENRLVIVDGVYSQDGDQAPLAELTHLAHFYNAYVLMDDAHGVGVVGATGRGVIEAQNCFEDVDFIMGTFSKALGHLGGYVVANKTIIRMLKYQSQQHLFSTSSGPASNLGIIKALELVDEEPQWRDKLWHNINYRKKGLLSLGLNIGPTDSAIPVKIGDIGKTLEAGRLLLKVGIYTNPILYPAVDKKDARIRLNIMATHEEAHLDKVLNAFDEVKTNLSLTY